MDFIDILLAASFVILAIVDTILTYKIIKSKKGYENAEIMEHFIKHPVVAISLTIIGIVALFWFLIWAGNYWEIRSFLILIPADIVFILVLRHNWKIWRS